MIAPRANGQSSSSSSTAPYDYYSQGLDTYAVPMLSLHATNRARLLSSMMTSSPAAGLILLEGGRQRTRYDTDTEIVFRQESHFHYLFGASSYAGCYGAIALPSGKTTMFVPTHDVETATVRGPCPDLASVEDELGVDGVRDVDELSTFVEAEMDRLIAREGASAEDAKAKAKLYLLKGLNTDSGKYARPAYYNGIEKYYNTSSDDDDDRMTRIDTTTLFARLVECRVIKSAAEIELMKYTNYISSLAHVATMRTCRPNMMEYQLESTFLHHTYYHGGCRHVAYTCICGCGPNSSILHYGHAGRPNSGRLLRTGDMALLDMGGEYHCYASDITCSYPVDGTFTSDQRSIYESVLRAQIAVIGKLKPGVSWVDMHHVAEREILAGLVECGVLVMPPNNNNNHDDDDNDDDDDNVDDVIAKMIDVDLGAVFMPHGLGHLIGLDVHDVGGYAPNTPPRSSRPGLKKLRTSRIMESGMVITVEPGCYFIDVLLDMALTDTRQGQYINNERLQDFRGFGGVRLEDDIWITDIGCVNLTQCPRAIDEVVHVMKGGDWPRECFDCYIYIRNFIFDFVWFAEQRLCIKTISYIPIIIIS